MPISLRNHQRCIGALQSVQAAMCQPNSARHAVRHLLPLASFAILPPPHRTRNSPLYIRQNSEIIIINANHTVLNLFSGVHTNASHYPKEIRCWRRWY